MQSFVMHEAWVLFASHVHWMGWNLILAFVPLALGASLFRAGRRRTVSWWLGFALFVAFLPNAPYVMSDLVHLPADARAASSMRVVLLGLLPLYAIYILAGLQAYVLSLGLLRRYMRTTGRRFLAVVDVVAAFCTAVGVFLGRVDRVNSWDPLLHPAKMWSALLSLPTHLPLILITTSVILIAAMVIWIVDLFALRVGTRLLSRLSANP
jgi:uncharacterized membrane protein